MIYDEENDSVIINLERGQVASCGTSMFTITDNAYNMPGSPWSYDKSISVTFSTKASGNWYDFSVVSNCYAFSRRF
jgi:hypothetical protein